MDYLFNTGNQPSTDTEGPSVYDYLGIKSKPETPTPKQKPAAETVTPVNIPRRATEIEYMAGETPQDEAYVPEVKFEDYWKNPAKLNDIRSYLEARDPIGGKQMPQESNEDYVKRWAKSMRMNEWNTALNAVPELAWLTNAKKEDVLKASKAYKLWDDLPAFFSPGGQSALEALPTIFAGAVSDPTTAASIMMAGGIGSPATLAAKRQAAKEAIKRATAKKLSDLTAEETAAAVKKGVTAAATKRAKQIGAVAATETVIGAGESAIQQQLDIVASRERDKQKLKSYFKEGLVSLDEYLQINEQLDIQDVSKAEAAFAGILTALPTVLGSKYFFQKNINQIDELDKALKTRKAEIEQKLKADKSTIDNKDDAAVVKQFEDNIEKVLNTIDLWEGRKILDKLSPQTILTDAQVQKTVARRAVDVAKYVILADPAFDEIKQRVANKSMKVMDAIGEVFKRMELEETALKKGDEAGAEALRINDVVLESAIKRAGLTPEEFGQITKTTISDAASIMQGASTISRILQKSFSSDPILAKVVADTEAANQRTSGMYLFLNSLKRMETNSKALVVSSIGTTVRNIAGTAGGLTLQTGADIIDGVLHSVATGVQYLKRGEIAEGLAETSSGMAQTFRDSFLTWNYLVNKGYGKGFTSAVVDKILEDNPEFKRRFLGALQETGNEELWWVSRAANTLNVLQDGLFRRAIFASSVERQLKATGMNMYDVLSQNKKISPDIIKNAADDALKATFSYVPKQQKGTLKTVEAKVESAVASILNGIEKSPIPGFTIAVTPFPRFIANALAFQYRYSPFGGASGMLDVKEGLKRIKNKEAGGEELLRQGREKFSRGVAGTSLLLAAYGYRSENQDVDPTIMKTSSGGTVDILPIFPLSTYFILADTMYKVNNNLQDKIKWEDVTSALTGLEQRAGTQNTFLLALKNGLSGDYTKESEKFGKDAGAVLGDFLGRYIQPGQPVFAYFDLFNQESQKVRDPNVIDERGMFSTMIQTAENRIANKLPSALGVTGLKVKTDLPENIPYFREETPYRPGEFFNLMKGVRELPAENMLEREFTSMSVDPYSVYGSSGNKAYDRRVRMNAQQFFRGIVLPYISSEKYKSLSSADKRVGLEEYVRLSLEQAANITKAEMASEDIKTVNRMKFNKLPSYKRKAINEKFLKENGITMDESDYSRVDEYEARLKESM